MGMIEDHPVSMRQYRGAAAATNSSESDEKIGSLLPKPVPHFANGRRPGYGGGDITTTGRTCRKCSRVFGSVKALSGHMTWHSNRVKCLRDDDQSWASDLDSDDDDRIIIRTKQKKRAAKSGSSVSEIDVEGEEEEGALCLMLLSKDSGNKCSEYSDNNSVILEAKSSPKKKKNKGWEDETHSDSDYFLDESAKLEPGIRRKLFANDPLVRSKRRTSPPPPPPTNGSLQKRSKYECLNCKKAFSSYQALGGHRPCHRRSCCEEESKTGENSPEEESSSIAALGAAASKRTSAAAAMYEKKNKGKKSKLPHVCPFCDRVFKNGQALGGHKRSHFIGNHRIKPVVTTKKDKKQPSDMLDLNLPAPEEDEEEDEDEEDSDEQFSGW
ncbi:hypothetical protein M569_03665 [Genlisea aurea]|uniref:C2H2-type domain-containing protein n=1 Tax=Genlisea aurea TaxID=192259 RepID=S8E5M5_9LAMI|nr:hypothetical protein M569_03665 [Genlisea aurea]